MVAVTTAGTSDPYTHDALNVTRSAEPAKPGGQAPRRTQLRGPGCAPHHHRAPRSWPWHLHQTDHHATPRPRCEVGLLPPPRQHVCTVASGLPARDPRLVKPQCTTTVRVPHETTRHCTRSRVQTTTAKVATHWAVDYGMVHRPEVLFAVVFADPPFRASMLLVRLPLLLHAVLRIVFA
jgi:hypothetical protein